MSAPTLTGRTRWDFRPVGLLFTRVRPVLQVEESGVGMIWPGYGAAHTENYTRWRDALPSEHCQFDVVLRPTPGAETENLATKQG